MNKTKPCSGELSVAPESPQLEFFADRVLTERSIESPGENGVANMRAIDAVVQSAQTGVPVELS
jgi:predicted dehydrogenase